jgi:hypothetical protein
MYFMVNVMIVNLEMIKAEMEERKAQEAVRREFAESRRKLISK